MTTRERILVEIEKVRDEELEEFYVHVRRFVARKRSSRRKPGALARLKRVQIAGPVDFAANLDLYSSGEKQLGDGEDLH